MKNQTKTINVTYKISQDKDGNYTAMGTFRSLKGMIKGRGVVKHEALEAMIEECRNCYTIPININLKEIPLETRW